MYPTAIESPNEEDEDDEDDDDGEESGDAAIPEPTIQTVELGSDNDKMTRMNICVLKTSRTETGTQRASKNGQDKIY